MRRRERVMARSDRAAGAVSRPDRAQLHASYFFDFHDDGFIQEVYRQLLLREPDPGGYAQYIQEIRAGESRYKILRDISRSSEAKEKGVHLRGLGVYQITRLLSKVPIVGTIVELLFFFARIKTFMKDLRAFENHVYRLTQKTEIE